MNRKTAIILAAVAVVVVLLAVIIFSTYTVDFDKSSIFPSHDKTLVQKGTIENAYG